MPRANERDVVSAAATRGVDVIHNLRRDCIRLSEERDRCLLRLSEFDVGSADPRTLTVYTDVLESLTRTTDRLQNTVWRAFNLNQVFIEPSRADDTSERDKRAAFLLSRLTGDSPADCASSLDASKLSASPGTTE